MNLYDKDISVVNMKGDTVEMSSFKGKILVIVNTASKCGFTPQFDGLEKLYQEYKDKDVMVLGFPCNQFKDQDPGTNEEIQSFCKLNYGVTFPMFQKIEVNGDGRHPLYELLIESAPERTGKDIRWNFEKFIVDKDGSVLHRYGSPKLPRNIAKQLDKMI